MVALSIVAAAVASGCGESEGVAKGAVVAAYVEASLCEAAQQELQAQGGRAGDVRVQAICLPSPHEAKKLNLATVGANARRATQDSTSVAYLEASEPRAARFTHRILETAQLPWIASDSGNTAMAKLLKLIDESGGGSLREQLREELHEM